MALLPLNRGHLAIADHVDGVGGERVPAGAAIDVVSLAVFGVDVVVALITEHVIRTMTVVEVVVAFVAGHPVVAVAAVDQIVARRRCGHLIGAAEGLHEAVGVPVYVYYTPHRSIYERTVAAVRSRLGQEAFEEARERGRMMTFEQAVEYAIEREGASPS